MRFWPCLPAYCVAALVAVRPDVIRGATVNFYPTCSSADNFGLTWPTVAGGASSPTYSVAGWGSAHPITLTISDTGTWAATAWYMNNVNGIWSQWFDASGTVPGAGTWDCHVCAFGSPTFYFVSAAPSVTNYFATIDQCNTDGVTHKYCWSAVALDGSGWTSVPACQDVPPAGCIHLLFTNAIPFQAVLTDQTMGGRILVSTTGTAGGTSTTGTTNIVVTFPPGNTYTNPVVLAPITNGIPIEGPPGVTNDNGLAGVIVAVGAATVHAIDGAAQVAHSDATIAHSDSSNVVTQIGNNGSTLNSIKTNLEQSASFLPHIDTNTDITAHILMLSTNAGWEQEMSNNYAADTLDYNASNTLQDVGTNLTALSGYSGGLTGVVDDLNAALSAPVSYPPGFGVLVLTNVWNWNTNIDFLGAMDGSLFDVLADPPREWMRLTMLWGGVVGLVIQLVFLVSRAMMEFWQVPGFASAGSNTAGAISLLPGVSISIKATIGIFIAALAIGLPSIAVATASTATASYSAAGGSLTGNGSPSSANTGMGINGLPPPDLWRVLDKIENIVPVVELIMFELNFAIAAVAINSLLPFISGLIKIAQSV